MMNNSLHLSSDPVLLLTRPVAQARQFANGLSPHVLAAIQLVVSPALQIRPAQPLPDLKRYQGLIMTSRNAVQIFAHEKGQFAGPVYTIGNATTRAAQDIGLNAIQAGQDAQSLIANLVDKAPAGPLVHLHGAFTRGAIAANLTQAGLPTTGHILYDQHPLLPTEQAQSALAGQNQIILPLFSPRTAQIVTTWGRPQAPLYIICLSPAVASAAMRLEANNMVVVAQPDATAMAAAIHSLVA